MKGNSDVSCAVRDRENKTDKNTDRINFIFMVIIKVLNVEPRIPNLPEASEGFELGEANIEYRLTNDELFKSLFDIH